MHISLQLYFLWLTFCCTRYVPNPADTLMKEYLANNGSLDDSVVTYAKGKIVAGDPAELNVINLPKPKGWGTKTNEIL